MNTTRELRSDITLSSGRVITHSLMPNGATLASVFGTDVQGMTPEEWREYCQVIHHKQVHHEH